eukprot:1061255-Pelagomonas_calceolata.AAC.3
MLDHGKVMKTKASQNNHLQVATTHRVYHQRPSSPAQQAALVCRKPACLGTQHHDAAPTLPPCPASPPRAQPGCSLPDLAVAGFHRGGRAFKGWGGTGVCAAVVAAASAQPAAGVCVAGAGADAQPADLALAAHGWLPGKA